MGAPAILTDYVSCYLDELEQIISKEGDLQGDYHFKIEEWIEAIRQTIREIDKGY